MNYQNNIDAYYAYAKENYKRRKKEERATWLWLIASILVLFGVWAYFNNLNLFNGFGSSEEESSKKSLSKVVLANDTTQKSRNEVGKMVKISQNREMSKKEMTKKQIAKKEIVQKQIAKNDNGTKSVDLNKKRVVQEKRPFELASKKDINAKQESNRGTKVAKAPLVNVAKNNAPKPENQVKIVPMAVVNGNTKDTNISALKESIAMGLTKKSDINSSLKVEGKSSVAFLENREINGSLKESTSKLGSVTVVEENSSVDLYHIYIVSKGESIYDIARKEYGDTQMYIKIVNANPDLTNPNKIREGQELYLPIVDESKSYSSILHFK